MQWYSFDSVIDSTTQNFLLIGAFAINGGLAIFAMASVYRVIIKYINRAVGK